MLKLCQYRICGAYEIFILSLSTAYLIGISHRLPCRRSQLIELFFCQIRQLVHQLSIVLPSIVLFH